MTTRKLTPEDKVKVVVKMDNGLDYLVDVLTKEGMYPERLFVNRPDRVGFMWIVSQDLTSKPPVYIEDPF